MGRQLLLQYVRYAGLRVLLVIALGVSAITYEPSPTPSQAWPWSATTRVDLTFHCLSPTSTVNAIQGSWTSEGFNLLLPIRPGVWFTWMSVRPNGGWISGTAICTDGSTFPFHVPVVRPLWGDITAAAVCPKDLHVVCL